LHTNAFDEAIALPTEASARTARNTQLILQHESQITHVIDPLGGSYYVEALTHSLAQAARDLIARVEKDGGMVDAVEAGWPKLEIEAAAARRQARIDRGEDVIVGVNKFRREDEKPIDIRAIDNEQVRAAQIAKLKKLKASRDGAKVAAALENLKKGAQGDANLLALAIEAARARATVGEISSALEDLFGRHRAEIHTLSGVYAKDFPALDEIANEVKSFAKEEGRRPRLLVAKLGQDGHDRGAKVIATAFGDLGFEVEIGALFRTPEEVVQDALDAKADAIGISSLAGSHLSLVPQLTEYLKAKGRDDILVLVGGVIPPQDDEALRAAGVAAIFGPGTHIPDAARSVLGLIRAQRRRNEPRGER
jgi:methylmalonyl-CoA mutase